MADRTRLSLNSHRRDTPRVTRAAEPAPGQAAGPTPAARAWLAQVARLPCILCGARPVQLFPVAHEPRAPAPLPEVIPLCDRHFRFRVNHGETWAQLYGWDAELLPSVDRAIRAAARPQ